MGCRSKKVKRVWVVTVVWELKIPYVVEAYNPREAKKLVYTLPMPKLGKFTRDKVSKGQELSE